MTIEKEVYRSGPFKEIFAQGVKVGNVLYLSGQVGIDEKGTIGSSIIEQTALAYENIAKVLAKFDGTLANVVDETMFVTDVSEVMANADAVFGARAKAYGGSPEVCQTLVQVSGLLLPELKLEIKCTAHL